MPEKVSITKTKLDNLANAISAKSGEPLNLTIDEMEAAVNGINIGEENVLEGVKVNGVELPIDNQKKVNIPAVSQNKPGVMTPSIMNEIYDEIPNKVSQLTNDEGYISTETDPTVPSWAKESTKPTYTAQEVGALPDTTEIPTKVSDLTNDSNYQTDTEVNNAITDALADIVGFSIEIVNTLPATGEDGVFYFVPNSGEQNNIYDEYLYVNNAWEKLGTTEIDLSNYLQKTDISAWAKEPNKPTYTASEVGAIPSTSPASSITNEDITSWNNKVSDDKTWNGVPLEKTAALVQNDTIYVFGAASTNPNTANFIPAVSNKTGNFASQRLAKYDNSGYLFSTTPSANDNSTKVATTAYVDRAVPTIPTNISSFTNDSGYLTLSDLPIYDGTVV